MQKLSYVAQNIDPIKNGNCTECTLHGWINFIHEFPIPEKENSSKPVCPERVTEVDPPRSLDFNPSDFYMWGHLKQ
jgi:hypothetical protein